MRPCGHRPVDSASVELLTPTLAPGESTGWTLRLKTEGGYGGY